MEKITNKVEKVTSKVDYLGVTWDCVETMQNIPPHFEVESTCDFVYVAVKDMTFCIGTFRLHFSAINLLEGDVRSLGVYEGTEVLFDIWNITVSGIKSFLLLLERLAKLEATQ